MPDGEVYWWQVAGATAGPTLALFSLAWQAREKLLQRPRLEVRYQVGGYRTGTAPDSWNSPMPGGWNATLHIKLRLLNTRPTSILVDRIEVRAKEHHWRDRLRRPFGRPLTTETRAVQIPSEGELRYPADRDPALRVNDYREVRIIRVVVRGRGFRRLRSPWQVVNADFDRFRRDFGDGHSDEHASRNPA
jgi:hypothetical protein